MKLVNTFGLLVSLTKAQSFKLLRLKFDTIQKHTKAFVYLQNVVKCEKVLLVCS